MQPNEREQNVFKSLSQSGEGQIVYGYLERLQQHLTNTLLDKEDPTPEDIAGAKQMRKLAKELQDRFIERAIISGDFERMS